MNTTWGQLITLEYGKPVPDKDCIDGAIPVYGTNGQIGTSNLPPLCKIPSLIIGRKGAYRGVHYSAKPFSVIDTAFYVLPKTKDVDLKWAYYKFLTYDINSMDSGSAIPSTDKYDIYRLEVELPNIIIQKKIVRVLECFDEKIKLNTQINRNLEEQLLSFWRHYYENATSEMTELKQLCSFQEGYVNPPQTKPEYFDGTIKWLRAVDINESYIISTSRTITNLGFASAGKSALLFPPDSIAISKSGTIGRLGIIADKMCGNRAVINIVPYQKQLLGFIYSYLKFHQNDFLNLAVGSVQKNLYVSSLEVLKIKTPYEDFWRNFNQIAHLFLTKIKNNCIEIQKLSNLRDTLLPKLMSGEIDVSEVEV